MTSIGNKMKQYTIIFLIALVVTIICFFVTPYPDVFLGLTLGFLVSYLNLLTIYQKTSLIGRIASNLQKHSMIPVLFAGFSYAIRISLVILALFVAMQFPDEVNLISVIAGISLVYVIIFVDTITQSGRKR
ncbi:ATP synthase subunit I [Alkalihalobacillus sp. 1P02AB]|uniref:ATP synthase subunit I n=1 Tax=Alkalihalobacillus sp. 1P02AB TaxID=3132260 RepID=UPI0039A73F7E